MNDDAGAHADFAAVDAGDVGELVAMMDATDAWTAVAAVRAWVLASGVDHETVVADVGSGSGAFGAAAASVGACATIDLDRSLAMLTEAVRRHRESRPVRADIAFLPLRDGAAGLVRAERVLQWTTDPHAALAELWRVTAPDGWLAATDTDWGSFAVEHPDEAARARFSTAALGWVPHARFASTMSSALVDLGAREVHTRSDTVVIAGWDPDDDAQRDGPPGLPLRSIAAGGPPGGHAALDRDLEVLADRARLGAFSASLVLVSALARR